MMSYPTFPRHARSKMTPSPLPPPVTPCHLSFHLPRSPRCVQLAAAIHPPPSLAAAIATLDQPTAAVVRILSPPVGDAFQQLCQKWISLIATAGIDTQLYCTGPDSLIVTISATSGPEIYEFLAAQPEFGTLMVAGAEGGVSGDVPRIHHDHHPATIPGAKAEAEHEKAAKAEAEMKAKEQRAREEAEKAAKEEAEMKAKEQRAREEAEKAAKEEAEMKAEEQRAREEAEKAAKEEAEMKAKANAAASRAGAGRKGAEERLESQMEKAEAQVNRARQKSPSPSQRRQEQRERIAQAVEKARRQAKGGRDEL